MKKSEQKACTWKDWAQGVIYSLLLIAFLVWIRASWWGYLTVPFVFDAYVTKKIKWQWWKEVENPVTKNIMSWVDAIVFALVAVYFVNIYFFQNYTIPSSSLEKSLLVGDYLYVSKAAYGPRAPMTPLSMPLCQHTLPGVGQIPSYIEWPQWEYKRISPKKVQLNDIVVFNYPSGDTVALNRQNSDYYRDAYCVGMRNYMENFGRVDLDNMTALERRKYFNAFYTLGRMIIKQNPREFGEVKWRPVDRRENYVKRCVGLPGQTLEIRDRIVYLDGKANKEPDNVQYDYYVRLNNISILQFLGDEYDEVRKELGISKEDVEMLYRLRNFDEPEHLLKNKKVLELYDGYMPLTKHAAKELKARGLAAEVQIVSDQDSEPTLLYPLNGHKGWTVDNYGPIWIPAKGASITLNLDNLPVYERCIRTYEGNTLEVTDEGDILINGEKATSYTFKMDYYWMQGDNRHNSADSRFWGFVPEDHVVGKPVMIWLSKSPDYGIFNGGIRWERLFRWVDNIK